MTNIDCPREQDLLDALASSRWPERADQDLRAHVAQCDVCRDTLVVALPLLTEGEVAYASARVPSSGAMWWRAQMRARKEAARTASRPITIVQAIAFTCGAVLVAAAAYWASPSLQNWPDWFGHLAGSFAPGAVEWTSLSAASLLPWMILAVWLILVPVAIYFAVADE